MIEQPHCHSWFSSSVSTTLTSKLLSLIFLLLELPFSQDFCKICPHSLLNDFVFTFSVRPLLPSSLKFGSIPSIFYSLYLFFISLELPPPKIIYILLFVLLIDHLPQPTGVDTLWGHLFYFYFTIVSHGYNSVWHINNHQ